MPTEEVVVAVVVVEIWERCCSPGNYWQFVSSNQ